MLPFYKHIRQHIYSPFYNFLRKLGFVCWFLSQLIYRFIFLADSYCSLLFIYKVYNIRWNQIKRQSHSLFKLLGLSRRVHQPSGKIRRTINFKNNKIWDQFLPRVLITQRPIKISNPSLRTVGPSCELQY